MAQESLKETVSPGNGSQCCVAVACLPGGSGKTTICQKYSNILYDIDDIWDVNGEIE